MEFVIGGLAATSAGFFTNPLEVAKHHMELNKKTQYTDYKYKNLLRSGYAVVKTNGLKSLQKGLSPALGAHLASYGMKLGIKIAFQIVIHSNVNFIQALTSSVQTEV